MRIYWSGWKAIVGGVIASLCVAIFLLSADCTRSQLGFWVFITFCAAALSLGAIGGQRCSLASWWQLFVTWFIQGRDTVQPNWVFQSPSGTPDARKYLLIVAMWFTTLACCFVTDHFSWLLTCDPDLMHVVGYLPESAPGTLNLSYFQRGRELAVFYFALTILVCTLAPAFLLLLVAYVVTSPLIHHLQSGGQT